MTSAPLIRNDAYDIEALRQRIASNADPVGALIDVANGLPLRFVETDNDGNPAERLVADFATFTRNAS